MGRSSKDSRDIFYRKGKEEGYRARSAYKLLHLDEMYDFLGRQTTSKAGSDEAESSAHAVRRMLSEAEASSDVQVSTLRPSPPPAPTKVVDLCAAPGSWSQVLLRTLPKGSRLVAVDLQPMAPLPGVVQVVGDITTQRTARRVAHALVTGRDSGEALAAGEQDHLLDSAPIPDEAKAQLIICDGAPDVTGLHALDENMQAQLLLAALTIVTRLLLPGGTFIAKIFARRRRGPRQPMTEGAGDKGRASHEVLVSPDSSDLLVQQLRCLFEVVDVSKPRSSRSASVEHFVVARRFHGHAELDSGDAAGKGRGSIISPFVESGDLSEFDVADE